MLADLTQPKGEAPAVGLLVGVLVVLFILALTLGVTPLT